MLARRRQMRGKVDGTGEQLRVVFTVPIKCYTFDWGHAAVARTPGMCSLAEQPKLWSHKRCGRCVTRPPAQQMAALQERVQLQGGLWKGYQCA